MVRDSLAVERAEMLKMIEHLQVIVTGLQDVDAGVSQRYAQDLQRLREAVAKAQTSSKWQFVLEIARDVVVRIAAEILKAWS